MAMGRVRGVGRWACVGWSVESEARVWVCAFVGCEGSRVAVAVLGVGGVDVQAVIRVRVRSAMINFEVVEIILVS